MKEPLDGSQLLEQIERIIAGVAGGSAADEARQILEAVSEEGPADAARAVALAEQRAQGAPLAALTGRTSFMGLPLYFEPGVFVVRPETELLGQTAVDTLRQLADKEPPPAQLRLIDVGCGSGNLSCAIATAVPSATIFAIDLAEQCVNLTLKNVARHGLEPRVTVSRGDLFAPLQGHGFEGRVDMVICNPPYIASGRLQSDRSFLLAHEPLEAFDGGPFGINMQQRLIKESPAFLRPGGYLLFEFGVGQHRQIERLFDRAGGYQSVKFARNEAGEERVAIGVKSG